MGRPTHLKFWGTVPQPPGLRPCSYECNIGIAPVNKLVSLTWLLWALRSFRSFTLHYIIGYMHDITHCAYLGLLHAGKVHTYICTHLSLLYITVCPVDVEALVET